MVQRESSISSMSSSSSIISDSSSTAFHCRTMSVDAPTSGFDLMYRGAKAAFRKYDNFVQKC